MLEHYNTQASGTRTFPVGPTCLI